MVVMGSQGVDRFDAVTEDAGEIDELTRAMFGASVRVERHDGRPASLRLSQAATAEVGVQRVTWNVDGRCDVAPLDRFLCIRLHRGAYGLDQGDGQRMYTAGDVFLVDPDRQVDAEVVGADLSSLTLDRGVLERTAGQIAPWSSGRLDHRRALPVTEGLGRAWTEALGAVERAFSADDLVAENALVRAGLLFQLVATACAAFELIPQPILDRPVTARAVRRAVAYIDEHLAEPITTGDVAAAAGLSVRGLHAAFQRVIGTSPFEYLRRARLHQARSELLDADDTVRVADVALRWGFAHAGRFAAAYRGEFGEPPNATLHG